MIHLNYVDSYQILNFHLFDGKNLELGGLFQYTEFPAVRCCGVSVAWCGGGGAD